MCAGPEERLHLPEVGLCPRLSCAVLPWHLLLSVISVFTCLCVRCPSPGGQKPCLPRPSPLPGYAQQEAPALAPAGCHVVESARSCQLCAPPFQFPCISKLVNFYFMWGVGWGVWLGGQSSDMSHRISGAHTVPTRGFVPPLE